MRTTAVEHITLGEIYRYPEGRLSECLVCLLSIPIQLGDCPANLVAGFLSWRVGGEGAHWLSLASPCIL